MSTIFINPRNNRLEKPKFIFIESKIETLVRYEDFGTNYVIDKNTGLHKIVKDNQFDKVFGRIVQQIKNSNQIIK